MNGTFDSFYTAWRWLLHHPRMRSHYGNSVFDDYLRIEVVRVNPKTESIDDNRSLNTDVRVWLECCVTENGERILDHDLDCGANTFELAIQELAKLVLQKYGSYPTAVCRG